MNREDSARIFKAFCDENRLEIIELLKKGEMCANDILKNVSIVQSTLSHHMKILCESGIISSRKAGKMTYFSVSNDGIDKASELLDTYRGIPGASSSTSKAEPGSRVKTSAKPEKAEPISEEDTWSSMVTFID